LIGHGSAAMLRPRHVPRIERVCMNKSLLIVGALACTSLTACYVVPIDPRTGQAYPVPAPRDSQGSVTIVTPPPAAAAPQPTTLSVRLYPLNPQANKGGLISALVVDNNAGHGTFTVPYLGDTLQGESTRVDSNYAAFGRIHNEVLGATPRSFSGRRGIANAYGSKGVNAQCEYLLTGPGSGTGACLFSDGAKYQMHFGG
jgi:hypothetical protein